MNWNYNYDNYVFQDKDKFFEGLNLEQINKFIPKIKNLDYEKVKELDYEYIQPFAKELQDKFNIEAEQAFCLIINYALENKNENQVNKTN